MTKARFTLSRCESDRYKSRINFYPDRPCVYTYTRERWIKLAPTATNFFFVAVGTSFFQRPLLTLSPGTKLQKNLRQRFCRSALSLWFCENRFYLWWFVKTRRARCLFQHFWGCELITTARAHSSGVIFILFPAFKQNKTVVSDRVLTLYRLRIPAPSSDMPLARRVPEVQNSSSLIKSSLPGSSYSRCSKKQTKPWLS